MIKLETVSFVILLDTLNASSISLPTRHTIKTATINLTAQVRRMPHVFSQIEDVHRVTPNGSKTIDKDPKIRNSAFAMKITKAIRKSANNATHRAIVARI